jgi:Immunity protein 44
MQLFMTIEAQGDAGEILRIILWDTICKLDFITNEDGNLEEIDNYGTEFQSIGVIPSCMDDGFWDALGWKERKQIWRKKKEADIRLRMDYERFVRETPDNQRLLFIDIIVKSILVVQEKSKGDFRGHDLIKDILKTLNVTQEQLDNLNQEQHQ